MMLPGSSHSLSTQNSCSCCSDPVAALVLTTSVKPLKKPRKAPEAGLFVLSGAVDARSPMSRNRPWLVVTLKYSMHLPR
jgi:hypothetical protein